MIMNNDQQIFHYIYKITFLQGSLKGYYYIGKKSSKIPTYLKGSKIDNIITEHPDFDNYTGSGTIPINYFKKYGKVLGSTYAKEILYISKDAQDNLINEEKIIGDKYKTDPLCVNLTKGGKLNPALLGKSTSHPQTEESNLKNSEAHKKLWQTTEYRERCLQGRLQYFKDNPAILCKNVLSEDTKNKLSEINKGKTNLNNSGENNGMYNKLPANAKRVIQKTLDGEFIKEWESAAAAKRELNIDNITAVCSGKRKSAGGFVWEWSSVKNKKDFNKVSQYTIDDVFINTFDSAYSAAKALNLDASSIYKVCQGKAHYCGGFKWKFYNNNGG